MISTPLIIAGKASLGEKDNTKAHPVLSVKVTLVLPPCRTFKNLLFSMFVYVDALFNSDHRISLFD